MLTLTMVWKNSPPIFCMTTEMVADLANIDLCCNQPSHPQKLNSRAEAVITTNVQPPQPDLADMTHDPYLQQRNANPAAYIDVFVDKLFESS